MNKDNQLERMPLFIPAGCEEKQQWWEVEADWLMFVKGWFLLLIKCFLILVK